MMSFSNQKEFSPFPSFEKFSEEANQPVNIFPSENSNQGVEKFFDILSFLPVLLSVAGLMMFTNPLSAAAENLSFDPALFQPVCHFSDVIYQFLKSAVGTFYVTFCVVISSILVTNLNESQQVFLLVPRT